MSVVVNCETREEVAIKKIGIAIKKIIRPPMKENFNDRIGSPDESGVGFLRSDNARRYVKMLPQFPKQNVFVRFPNMSPGAVDLLEKMLVFDPNKHITCTLI
ncbi:hypothetical protein Ddye_025146 [Dipteronia dyeriana]|uniref:Uncharacterized protein n=1 Tax=Dipteronia dyeriana TaxID=168575 RepID=A0AAD9WUV2_9ROSI|nr:hypothetical protein Ddye_025146 [Dipteronia dyeriana]